MGMAASQARLLSLTARIIDVEHQAQSIQHAKLQLATQSDQIYQDYLAALDATTLAVTCINPQSAVTSNVAATFSNLCSRNRVRSADGTQYALRNSDGLLIVEDDIYEAYYSNNFSSPQEFAMYMMFGEDAENLFDNNGSNTFEAALQAAELEVYQNHSNDEDLNSIYQDIMEYANGAPNNPSIYDIPNLYTQDNIPEDYEEKLNRFRNLLYSRYSNEVFQELYTDNTPQGTPAPELDKDLVDYYMSLFSQIRACGGCISINDYNGPSGNAAHDSEWLTNMVKSGLISIEEINTDPKTGQVTLSQASPSSETCISYIEKTEIDSKALAKAEAEYNHKLKQINSKDKKFDMDLSKLDTERQALTKQVDSVQKVIQDNIDRTFKIFS